MRSFVVTFSTVRMDWQRHRTRIIYLTFPIPKQNDSFSLDSLTPVMSPQKALGLNDTSQDSQRTETIRPKNSTLLVRPSKPKPKQSYLNETRGREDSRRGPEPVYRRPQVMGQSRNNRKNRAPYSEHILLEASAADDHIKNGRFVGQSSRLIPVIIPVGNNSGNSSLIPTIPFRLQQTSGIGNSSNILPAVRRQPSMYPSRGDRMIGGENYGTLKITYSDLGNFCGFAKCPCHKVLLYKNSKGRNRWNKCTSAFLKKASTHSNIFWFTSSFWPSWIH